LTSGSPREPASIESADGCLLFEGFVEAAELETRGTFCNDTFKPFPFLRCKRLKRAILNARYRDQGCSALSQSDSAHRLTISRRAVNTLVLVHRQQLLEQWVERLSQFLGVPPKSIGRLGGGRRKLTGTLDVALLQSLVRKGTVDDVVANYGHLVVDECHHLSARSFELVARRAKVRFVTGLSATVVRKDGHHPIIFMQCGPVRHRVDAKAQAAARPFEHHVMVRPTAFRAASEPDADARVEFQQLCGELVHDDPRNAMICEIGRCKPTLEADYPDLPLLWLDTEESQGEVFVIRARDL
jgi:hypothetical protein